MGVSPVIWFQVVNRVVISWRYWAAVSRRRSSLAKLKCARLAVAVADVVVTLFGVERDEVFGPHLVDPLVEVVCG